MEDRVKRLEAVCLNGPTCPSSYSAFPQLVIAYIFIVAYIYLKILVHWRNATMPGHSSLDEETSHASFIEDDYSRLTLP